MGGGEGSEMRSVMEAEGKQKSRTSIDPFLTHTSGTQRRATTLSWQLVSTFPQSTSCVVMTIRLAFNCQIIRHMSATVVSFGPIKTCFGKIAENMMKSRQPILTY